MTHRNGECWLDVSGQPIQAHGGGILIHDGWYYWYGENRNVPIHRTDHRPRVNSIGVSCYRSRNLLAWEHLGVVLPASDDPTHDLYDGRVIERPKVVFNEKTGRFVMWMHVDSPDYEYARAGVAVAERPDGPFKYLESFRPAGSMSRDQTVFLDDDGRAYHVTASDDNANTLISVLSDDYLKPSGEHVRAFQGRFMEAFAICKRQNRYYLLASGCTGWKPNAARSAVADSLLGPWRELENPCVGEGREFTYHGQSAFILPPMRRGDPYVAMFDIWRPDHLRTSGYMWLPIAWNGDQMSIPWQAEWAGR